MRFFKYTDEKNKKTNTSEKSIKASRSSSFWAKIICILAALLVWFYVSGEQSPTFDKEFNGVPVVFEGMSQLEKQGYTIISGTNATVDVTLSGKRTEINNITKNDILPLADVSGIYAPGEYTLEIELSLPAGITAKSVGLDSVVVYVDKSSQKEFSVLPRIISGGTSEIDLKIDELEPAYTTVRVTGPEEELSKISHAAIDVALDKLIDSSVEYTGQVYLVGINGEKFSNSYVKTDKTEIKVLVPVKKYKTVPIEVSYVDKRAEELGYSASLFTEDVEICGNKDIIDATDSIKTQSFDAEKINSDTTVLLSLAVPPGIELAMPLDAVSVHFTPSDKTTKGITISNICIINTAKGLKAVPLKNSVTLNFTGKASAVSGLDASEIYVIADMKKFTKQGQYNVKLDVVYPENSGVTLSGDYYLDIRIEK